LPRIVSSSEVFSTTSLPAVAGVAIASDLGDQQAALVGQACFKPGEAKNTYGTGCFMLMNTGEKPVRSNFGLLTTVAYKFGVKPACYALEGSIAITGALVQWLRDHLGLIEKSADIEALARTVDDIAGAVLEATAFQVREVFDAIAKDSGIKLDVLRVDGGMVVNDLLMQFQSDILAKPVVRPRVIETTALGAAYAAGVAVGFFQNTDELAANWAIDRRWEPKIDEGSRERLYRFWKKAVTRAFDWVESQ